MSGPDIVVIRDLVSVVDRAPDVIRVGYTFLTSEGSHSHTPASIGALAVAANLSDLSNVAAARANLGAVAISLIDAKGDLLAGTGPDALARLPVGANGRILTADSGQSSGLAWADPPVSGMDQVHPLALNQIMAATAPLESYVTTSSFGSSSVSIAKIWVPAGKPVPGLYMAVATAGTYTSGGPNQLAIYDESGVKLQSTADDSTLWAGTGWRGGALVGGTIPAGAGRVMYVGAVCNGYSGVVVPYAVAGSNSSWLNTVPGVGTVARRCMFTFDGSLPGSFNPASYGGAGSSFIPPIVIA